MANDYLKKQPTKNEKMMYDLFMHQDQMSRSLWTTTSFVTAMALILKVDPKDIAKLMTTDHAKIKEYSDKINAAIAEIEKTDKDKAPQAAEAAHDHGDHEGHSHE